MVNMLHRRETKAARAHQGSNHPAVVALWGSTIESIRGTMGAPWTSCVRLGVPGRGPKEDGTVPVRESTL